MDQDTDQSRVTTALQHFIDRYRDHANRLGKSFPAVPKDPDWPSPCLANPDDLSAWQPVPQVNPLDFRGLEHALEIPIHPDIKAYYGSFWSATLEATATEGHVSLIQLWNQQDFERLIQNLIGHAMAKKRARQEMTVFVANTEPDSEHFLSIDNKTGNLVLEHAAKGVVKQVDTCVADLLERLTPDLDPPSIY
jgi:SecY interacting protein Syd